MKKNPITNEKIKTKTSRSKEEYKDTCI